MIDNHLNDEEIQQYLDRTNPQERFAIDEHLKTCTGCQRQVELYMNLYNILDKDPVADLSPEFSEHVISNIKQLKEDKLEKYESGFYISLVLIGIAVCFYFINPLPLIAQTGSTILGDLPAFGAELISKLNGNLPFVLIAAIIFLLVELFDKKILKTKV
jgi:hypothetical protein